jgi:hypothetical protein
MFTLFVFHFVAGILLGLRFRFGVIFAIAALAVLEGVVADDWLEAGPWYIISFCALLASQAGYVASAFLLSNARPEPIADRRGTDLPSEAMH